MVLAGKQAASGGAADHSGTLSRRNCCSAKREFRPGPADFFALLTIGADPQHADAALLAKGWLDD
jgi:hypothetical protein